MISAKDLVQPSEDDREDYDFPEINFKIVQGMAQRNAELYQQIKDNSDQILTSWTSKVRTSLSYLGKPFLIWAKGEIESPEAWKNFLDKESYKISEPTKPFDAMVVFDSH